MTRRDLSALWLAVFACSSTFLESIAWAQTPPVLSLQLTGAVPVLGITGESGTPCTLQIATNLNPPGAWQAVSNFTLGGAPVQIQDGNIAGNPERYYRVMLHLPTNSAWISAGTFTMGSPTNELARSLNETQHVVTLTRGFFLGKFPVTQSSYLSLMSTNPSYYTPANGFAPDLSRPVEQVSWSDATNYCARLTQQERAAGRIFTNWSYRLPTEAEWEFAGRAGTSTPFHQGTNLLSGMANFNGQFEYRGGIGTTNNPGGIFLGRTTAVGSYPPNPAGLNDMTGNVREWCADWFASYPASAVIDPTGPATGTTRVFRGGAFNSIGADCRSARRNSANPSTAANTIGFRVVLSAP